jgi:hypothetical protein
MDSSRLQHQSQYHTISWPHAYSAAEAQLALGLNWIHKKRLEFKYAARLPDN